MLLIVDDDPSFLDVAARLLNSGKGVLLARDAEQAKELIRSVGAAFGVVLVDLCLPGQDGFSLIHEIHYSFPDLPVIAISGVWQPDALESAKLFGAVKTLRKPITAAWTVAISEARNSVC